MLMKLLKIAVSLGLLAGVFASGYLLRATRHPATAQSSRRILYYVDPMHPAYTSDKPGVAPDCGMTLEPVYGEESSSAFTVALGDSHSEPGPTSVPAGAIRISPERQQMIGVKFATAEAGDSTRAIRAVGKVSVDETRVSHVHTRIDGWIEKVFINFTGDVVKQGEPMLTIYSPEMLASQEELLLAARAREVMPSLLDAARRRLQLWQLSEDQIENVLATGQPIRSITVNAPMSGFVTERNAFPNQKVTPDSDLYTITDLSRVWIVADVFESDIRDIKPGDAAYVTFANGGAPSLAARVNYIQPQVDPTTRTLKVRLDAKNPGLQMRPEMFVNVEFGARVQPQLTIPVEAVLDTGDRQTVFVDLGNGYLQPRPVTIGERLGDRVAIASGLATGDRVVSSGTFLIDSESQLKAAVNGMGAPPHQHDGSISSSSQPSSTPTSDGMSPHAGHSRD
jgi:multidrug efflux pump subunit AcrA (membrane-fusion protein)